MNLFGVVQRSVSNLPCTPENKEIKNLKYVLKYFDLK